MRIQVFLVWSSLLFEAALVLPVRASKADLLSLWFLLPTMLLLSKRKTTSRTSRPSVAERQAHVFSRKMLTLAAF